MTDSVPDTTDDRLVDPLDGTHRQHASADVAPELFEDASERQ
ncbi:hypothetical protein [Halorubrum sp. ASP1]|jgi:hypothetical protein|nr:hypothetical protein [Halorubrum sp. ASP1]